MSKSADRKFLARVRDQLLHAAGKLPPLPDGAEDEVSQRARTRSSFASPGTQVPPYLPPSARPPSCTQLKRELAEYEKALKLLKQEEYEDAAFQRDLKKRVRELESAYATRAEMRSPAAIGTASGSNSPKVSHSISIAWPPRRWHLLPLRLCLCGSDPPSPLSFPRPTDTRYLAATATSAPLLHASGAGGRSSYIFAQAC